MIRWRPFPVIALGILFSATALLDAGDAGTECTLANRGVSRTISWADGVLGTKAIKNRLAGKEYKLKGHEFEIVLDGAEKPVIAADCRVTGAKREETEGGTRLTVTLSSQRLPGTVLRAVYELKDKDFFGRKWIEIDPPAETKLPVALLSVESLDFPRGTKPSHGVRRNQPLYIGDTFYGLEWPRSGYPWRRSALLCTHWPAWDVKQGFRSKSAVWGAAPRGEVANWFVERYVPTIRLSPPRPILVYNSWYDIRGAKFEAYKKTITGFRDRLVKKHGVTLDSFVVDDGWQNKDSIYETRFPDGLDKLRETVEKELPGCHLGLWMPISGRRSGLNKEWGRKHGYEVATTDGYGAYCLLGEKYTTALKARLKHFISDLNINYFKHDFNSFLCSNPDHGHRVAGGASVENQVEGTFRCMRYVKGLNREVFLNYTTGMGLNPWWLMGCDSVFFGGHDTSQSGLGPPREQAITYRAEQMRRVFGPGRCQFPPNAIMTCGIIKGNYRYDWKNRPIEEWEHYVLMYFGRGLMMWELYITPSLLTDGEWAFLAETIKWARKNADVLAYSTRFILGDATKLEPYGYAHSKDDRCILFVRNLSMRKIAELSKGWKVLRTAERDQIPAEFVRPDFDDASWQTVNLPGDGKRPFSEEHIAYRSRFKVPVEWKGKPVRLQFDGVADTCVAYVNGAKVGNKGRHRKAPFDFDVAKHLRYGEENLIAVLVHNNRGSGGIHKSVGFAVAELGSQPVSFTLDARICGFDPKYKRAEVKWIYPEERTEPRTLKVGKPWTFRMKSFDVLVLDLSLKEK